MKTDIFTGPCMLESRDLAFKVCDYLKNELEPMKGKINFYFKGSFDKANRSAIDSDRGPGLEEGLRILEDIKNQFNVKTITDFHLPEQALAVAEVVDVLQIPAFLCRQTDIVVAGAQACQKFDRELKVKKGQFLAPEDTLNIVEKAAHYIPKDKILLTERGTSFGYNNLIVDMASFQIMKSFGVRAVHDCTHSVQKPGGLGKTTGGKREQIKVLSQAAAAAGADGFFMEAHPHPEKALSDSTSQLPMQEVPILIRKLLEIKEVVSG
jgi:2-dehydro-3-deoxyphosphooctonate aldolase (KDO 8-P synthase)